MSSRRERAGLIINLLGNDMASHLLCWRDTVAPEVGDAGSAPADEGATVSMGSPDQEIDEPVFMKENLKLGPL